MAPAVTLRIAIGSATAFLCAHLLDVTIFDRLRHGTWWSAPLVSTLIGSTLDTILFFFISFSLMMTSLLGSDHNIDFFNEIVMGPLGFEQTRWIATAMVDWSVKVSIALVALIPFRMIVVSYHARNNLLLTFLFFVSSCGKVKQMKGGGPVSKEVLERGVGTVEEFAL